MSIKENGNGLEGCNNPGDCKKPAQLGLRGEDRLSYLRPYERRERYERHLSGAKAFQNTERAYNGGASVVDKVDRMNF